MFSDEPILLDPTNPEKNKTSNIFSGLLNHPRLTVTPHCAGWTEECWKVVEADVIARVKEIMEGKPITIKSADPRLQNQEALGCYYPNRRNNLNDKSGMLPDMFVFERESLLSMLDSRLEESRVYNQS